MKSLYLPYTFLSVNYYVLMILQEIQSKSKFNCNHSTNHKEQIMIAFLCIIQMNQTKNQNDVQYVKEMPWIMSSKHFFCGE